MVQKGVADTVLFSNAIFTGVEDIPIEGGIAIKGNKILAVASREEIKTFIGDSTTIHHYEDQLIMPGFNDLHIHLFLGSLSQESVSLLHAKSEEEAALMVKEFADSRPDDPWIFGFNWYHIYWDNKQLPHKSTLDTFIPDRPVFLVNDECHGAWVNSKALELMGINKDTPDPPFGEIARDENGEPTGFLYETAMGFAQIAFDTIPKERQTELLETFLHNAARLGVTSISDMLPLPGLELGNLQLYKEFEDRGKLTCRIHFLSALNGDLDRPRKLKKLYHSPKLQFSGLKQFLDGVPTTYTAYLVEPYSDKPNTRGNTLIPEDYVRDWIMDADKEGFRIRLHACGDGAVKLGLDCFEEAEKRNGSRDSRHTIEHVEVIHPEDLPRFSKLGVIASIQPEHLASDTYEGNVYPIRFGKEREELTFPLKTLQSHGARVAFGSDFPVVQLNPLDGIYRAITRKHLDGLPVEGWNSQEKITLAQAIKGYTFESAYGIFRENELGTIESGKLADIVVLDKNLFTMEAEEIKNAEVILTMMDGEVVYRK